MRKVKQNDRIGRRGVDVGQSFCDAVHLDAFAGTKGCNQIAQQGAPRNNKKNHGQHPEQHNYGKETPARTRYASVLDAAPPFEWANPPFVNVTLTQKREVGIGFFPFGQVEFEGGRAEWRGNRSPACLKMCNAADFSFFINLLMPNNRRAPPPCAPASFGLGWGIRDCIARCESNAHGIVQARHIVSHSKSISPFG
ncbi:hypothetical protein [Jhaorihella thermophila]|uniref:hypothetical protein n=1 Tax=Jhaorihella thermophila TaxID=488547 RepID=UPI00135AB093|nr:hypothetical protein [Jhaorihella thermophila]